MPAVAFHRPARTYPEPLPQGEIVIDAPPQKRVLQQGGGLIMQIMMPVVGSLGSLTFILASPGARSNPLAIFAALSVALFSVAIGLGMRFSQTRALNKQRKQDATTYSRYLQERTAQLDDTVRRQRASDNRLWPPTNALVTRATKRELMWERRLEDFDFLDMRVGSAPATLSRPVRLDLSADIYAENKYVQNLLGDARRIVEKYAQLEDTPIRVPLKQYGTVTVIGKRTATRALVRSLVCQMATLHAPDDVRVIASFDPAATKEWGWMKWLPHARRMQRTKDPRVGGEIYAMLADNPGDFREILEKQVLPELERRTKLSGDNRNQGVNLNKPHFVIIIDDFIPKSPAALIPLIDGLLRNPGGNGVTLLLLVDDRHEEPSTVNARLEVFDGGFLAFEETELNGRRLMGVFPERTDVETGERIARALAPITLKEKGAESDLAADIRLLDLLQVQYADHVHVRETWRPRSPQEMLRVPIGIRADGEPLILDMKESAVPGGMGPHGLVIGATGSGKSELMRSIVTSLAITHSPDELNFVLADFKGGASFADLQNLPHVSGMVTNLKDDSGMLDRFYAALSGEQERRQRMLRDAGNLDKVSAYQQKRAANPSMDPMPYLLIIIDEFAEMLVARPEFLDPLFLGIGRVGRSIGMHLLFATQRLEEGKLKGLDAFLSYRICLRTFSAQESNTVLSTPDAYYLPTFPGIGYLKVGTSLYEKFKTALISNPYVPPATSTEAIVTIREFTPTGKLLECNLSSIPKPTNTLVSDGETKTDMAVVIDHLKNETPPKMAHDMHQVWLPPLPANVTMATVLERCGTPDLNGSAWPTVPPFGPLRIPVGLVDRPIEQSQEPFFLDFSGAGGHLALVGAPQSGKSSLLRTILTSFMVTHTPRDVQFYCIDYGGSLLRGLDDAPHVGVVCSGGERDKTARTISQMRGLIEERDALFRKRGIDNMTTFRERRRNGELDDVAFGDVFLVIDDLGKLLREFEQMEADLIEIIASGLTYGVHVLIAAGRWAEIRSRVRDNIALRLELRVTEPTESEIDRKIAATVPQGLPGRGINQAKLQYQAALPIFKDAALGAAPTVQASITALVQRAHQAWPGEGAPKIRMLPVLVTLAELPLSSAHPAEGIPYGIEEFKLDPVYLDLIGAGGPHFLVYGDGESGKTNLLHVWLRGLRERYSPEEVNYSLVDFRRTSLDFAQGPHFFGYAFTAQMLKDMLERLKKVLDSRGFTSSQFSIEDIRAGVQWAGPHHFLFIDDFDNLASGALQPIGDWILMAKDIGFHLVVMRRVAGSARGFDPVITKVREMGTSALIMSGEPAEGPLAGTQKASRLPAGRGYLVRRNQRTALVQIAKEG